MNVRKLFPLLMALVLLLSFTGCGMASESGVAYDQVAPELNKGNSMEVPSDSTASQVDLPENRKMIQKVWIDTETEDMDAVMSGVNDKIRELGGYVEAQQSYNGSSYSGTRRRTAELTVRIPEDKLEQFVEQVNAASNVVSTNRTVDDIPLSYVATESRILALETQQTRLLELLGKAETMEDLLTIEKELTNVLTELEQVKSTLKVYDNQINYATIYLTVTEVKELTVVEEPESVWERIGNGFMDSLEGVGVFFRELFVFIVAGLPVIAVFTGLGIATWLIIRHYTKKSSKKTPPPPEKVDN